MDVTARKLHVINPRSKRHKDVARFLFNSACTHIESLDGRIAGCALVTWDDRGVSSTSWCEGGPIATEAISTYAARKIEAGICINRSRAEKT